MILSYTAMSDGSLDYLSDMDQTQQSDESSSNSTCEINNFSDDDRCNDTESRNNHVNLQLNNQILYQHAALGNQQPLACMEDFLKRVKNITKRKTVGAERNKAFLQIVKDFREKMPDRKLRCKICGFISHRADHVKTHLARHANLKLYQCAMCGKVFTRYW